MAGLFFVEGFFVEGCCEGVVGWFELLVGWVHVVERVVLVS